MYCQCHEPQFSQVLWTKTSVKVKLDFRLAPGNPAQVKEDWGQQASSVLFRMSLRTGSRVEIQVTQLPSSQTEDEARMDRYPSIIQEVSEDNSPPQPSRQQPSDPENIQNGEYEHTWHENHHHDVLKRKLERHPGLESVLSSFTAVVAEAPQSQRDPLMKISMDREILRQRKRHARLPWLVWIFGWERVGNMGVRSYMIHPESPFVVVENYLQCMLLLYL